MTNTGKRATRTGLSLPVVGLMFLACSLHASWTLAQALPAEAKLSLFVRVPKKLGEPALQVVSQNSVPVQIYLLSEGDQVLAKKSVSTNIVAGAMNLSMGPSGSASCSASSGYTCEGGLQVLTALSGSSVSAKWLNAVYGSGTVTAEECYNNTTQTVGSCSSSEASLNSPRFLLVQFSVKNQSNEDVALSFKVKAGSAFYSHYAQMAMGVAQDVIDTLHLKENSVTSGKIADGEIVNADISATANVAWSKLAPVSNTSRLVGRYSAGSGPMEEISLGSGLNLSGGVLSATSSGGTVTSVNVGVPSFMTSSGGPITTSGTINLSFNDQSNYVVLASPADGSSGAPSFRQLRISDIRSSSTGNPAFLVGACSSGQMLNYNSVTDRLECQSYTLDTNSVGAGQIQDGAVTTAKLADGAVTGAKIADGAITGAKIADSSIVGSKLENSGVTAGTYTKVTVDAKGRVTSGASLAAGDIPNLDASKITTGTMDAARLPAADGSGSSNQSGIVSMVAQTFKGLKTFLNGISVTGGVAADTVTASGNVSGNNINATGNLSGVNVNASGQVSANTMNTNTLVATGNVSGQNLIAGNTGYIKTGTSTATCDTSLKGAIRYNDSTNKIEFCNGTAWQNISVIASLSIGSPSPARVSSSSSAAQFVVTYGSGVDVGTISLNASHVTINGDNAGCNKSVSGSGSTRTVSISGCTASTGTISISIAANTAQSITGDPAPAAGPSASVTVDNAGPNAPTGLSLGSVPNSLSSSPTISYTAATDVGGGTISSHQVCIELASSSADSCDVQNWTTHTSGNAVTGLSLAANTQYRVRVRAIDDLGNQGSHATDTWTSLVPFDCSATTPPLGALCNDGTYYIGTIGGVKYFTTPGGCGYEPSGHGGSSPASDFTPTCSGTTDSTVKPWNDGSTNYYDIPGIQNYTVTIGTGFWSSNTDANSGSHNTAQMVAITNSSEGGLHAAAHYCDKLSFGSKTDWFLPNRYELDLLRQLGGSLQSTLGVNTGGSWYWSSSEYHNYDAWVQRFSDGYQTNHAKYTANLVRCFRKQ